MSLFSKMNYYLNYLNFYRGDNQIKSYFSSNPYNKAIKELTEEGFVEFREKFEQLVDSFSLQYPLNSQEMKFIKNIQRKSYTIQKFRDFSYFSINIREINNYIISFKKKKNILPMRYKFDLIKFRSETLKKKLDQIWPITDAVITRRLSKKLLEILIKKNINQIELPNYSPDIKILRNYETSIKNNYIYRSGISKNIRFELEKLISETEKENKCLDDEEEKKEAPKIKYLNKDGIEIKIIQVLFEMKSACNHIIHFLKDKNKNLNFDNYLYENIQIQFDKNEEEEEIEEEEEELTIRIPSIKDNKNKDNKNIDPKKKIDKNNSISNVANFITFGKSSYSLEKKFVEFYEQLRENIKKIQVEMNNLTQQTKIYGCEEYKQLLLDMKYDIDSQLSNLVLKNYNNNNDDNNMNNINNSNTNNDNNKLSKTDIQEFKNYFKKNIFDIGDIKRHEISQNLSNSKIDYIDNLRKDMCVKDKLLFNSTFDINIEYLNLKLEIDELIKKLGFISVILQKIKQLEADYNAYLEILKKEYSNIKVISKYINRDEIFTNISKEEFIQNLKSLFTNEYIDYNDEIDNFYFYIFLLKKELFDEKSYKSAIDINDDYI